MKIQICRTPPLEYRQLDAKHRPSSKADPFAFSPPQTLYNPNFPLFPFPLFRFLFPYTISPPLHRRALRLPFISSRLLDFEHF
ncbi:hypothetical protein SDJN02_20562, partial [Cucurbita argyrosperma subsp. argyrosperma]